MNYFNDFTLYGYTIKKDCIELLYPGGVITLIKENDIKQVLQWIDDAKKIKVDTRSYINYMIRETW